MMEAGEAIHLPQSTQTLTRLNLRTALDMNAEVLWATAEVWVEVFDFEAANQTPRTMPLKMVQTEAIQKNKTVNMVNIILIGCFMLFRFFVSCGSLQVTKFWHFMLDDDVERSGPSKTMMYADAWGIRKLISHALRNLRQDRSPRAPWLQTVPHLLKILLIVLLHLTSKVETAMMIGLIFQKFAFGLMASKSRAVQHLNMIFIRAWYLEMPQQDPPVGVGRAEPIEDAMGEDDGEDDGGDVAYDDAEDHLCFLTSCPRSTVGIIENCACLITLYSIYTMSQYVGGPFWGGAWFGTWA